MKMKAVLFGAILGAFAGHAHSADIATENQIQFEPIEEQVWSGIYLGVGIGAGAVVNDINIGPLGADGVGGEGLLGEVMFGLQHQFQNDYVLGVEGAVGYKDFETTAGLGPLSLEASPEWTARASLKAGRAFDDTLLYLFGGYSYMDAYQVDISGPGFSASFDQQYHGYHVGAGIDHMFTPNWALGLRYQYTQYQDENWTVSGLSVEPSSHQGMLTLTYLANLWN